MTSLLLIIGLGVLTNMFVDRPAFKEATVAKVKAMVAYIKAEYHAMQGTTGENKVIIAEKKETEQGGPQ